MSIWKALTKKEEQVGELTHKWNDIKDDVKELALITNNNQIIKLPPNMEKYVQAFTGSADLATGSKNIQIESRYIGFALGNKIVKIRVNENNNNISVEVE